MSYPGGIQRRCRRASIGAMQLRQHGLAEVRTRDGPQLRPGAGLPQSLFEDV